MGASRREVARNCIYEGGGEEFEACARERGKRAFVEQTKTSLDAWTVESPSPTDLVDMAPCILMSVGGCAAMTAGRGALAPRSSPFNVHLPTEYS